MDCRSQRKRSAVDQPAPSLNRRGVGTVCSSNMFPHAVRNGGQPSPSDTCPWHPWHPDSWDRTRTSRSQRTVVGQYFQRE